MNKTKTLKEFISIEIKKCLVEALGEEYGGADNPIADKLMQLDNKVWDRLDIQSGSQLREIPELYKKYFETITRAIDKSGLIAKITPEVLRALESENYHTLIEVLQKKYGAKFEEGLANMMMPPSVEKWNDK